MALLFGVKARVGRREYLWAGVVLMGLKYALDVAIIHAATGHVWTPLEYLSPAMTTRTAILGEGNTWALVALLVLALPFLWVGLSMSLRRAVDAGVSPALALLFLVPGMNYLLMLTLAALPTASAAAQAAPAAKLEPGGPLVTALLGVAVGVALALGVTLFSTLVLGEYGLMLFFVTPALVGASVGFIYNRGEDAGALATMMVGLLAVLVAGMAMLLFAIEGMICLLMAAPLAAPMAIVGALIGRQIARAGHVSAASLAALVLLLPVLTAAEAGLPAPLVEREVRTRVVIDAPPAAVWPNVVGFSELDAPPAWIYGAGVAYPLRARIEGEGVGAVRHCEFTTGAFVEPITAWEPGARLSFDVASQPAPMHEWSPYRHVHPPHLDGYLRSRRGEFRLRDLGDGRTELEGSTWYTLDLAPAPYWAIWSDALMHGIHGRVLTHIKALSERGAVSVPAAVDDVQG